MPTARIDSPCDRVRHGLPVCRVVDLVDRLRADLAASRAMQVRLADRILAAHDVLAKLAERREVNA